jgi:hypothetical protein
MFYSDAVFVNSWKVVVYNYREVQVFVEGCLPGAPGKTGAKAPTIRWRHDAGHRFCVLFCPFLWPKTE